ncbi:MAG TPA: phospho-sugar mutase [Solirubrobacteraceae bacterium]|nr:phospho-sugar mutase [Solirubrobacteraceae bacterium]
MSEGSPAGALRFGTAGLRAPMGPGPGRMNREAVRRASAGLAAFVVDRRRQDGTGGEGTVLVGHDARHCSAQFARDAAAVFAGAGLRGLLIDGAVPTPVLAHHALAIGADTAVMITASHNPATDNGYKVYGSDGVQIIPPHDEQISALIDAVGADEAIPLRAPEPLAPESVIAGYLDSVVPAALAHVSSRRELSVVYTPVHGVGAHTLQLAFRAAGFPAPALVAEQAAPDPDFPTAPKPNPEEPGVLDLALRDARAAAADVVLANDPDADRLAVAVPWSGADGGWRMLTGDEVGALLADELLAHVEDPEHRLLVTTIVSSSLLARQAHAAGAHAAVTLTGFKWIMHATEPGTALLLGYEQALGYGVTDLVRDKDGISAALAMAAICARARADGSSVRTRLDRLAERFGLHVTSERSLALDTGGGDDAAGRLLAAPPNALIGRAVTAVDDLAGGTRLAGDGTVTQLGLPPSSGVVIHAGEEVRLAVRPSGTEPKLKLYLQIVLPVAPGGADEARLQAGAMLDALGRETEELIGR